MQNKKEGVFASSGNVFADLGLPEPDVRMAKALLAQAIRARIKEYGLNQTQAAERLGITQARVSEIMNGKVGKTSYDLLLNYLNTLQCDVEITIVPRRPIEHTTNAQEASFVHERGHILVGVS